MLKVITELKDLIPPISETEYRGLEQSIIEEGCRDAIIVWGEIIIDGHNRFRICKEHDIEFRTVNKDFKDLNQAKLFIIKNQLGKRNVTDYGRAVLALEMKGILTQIAKDKEAERKRKGKTTFHIREKSPLPKINTNKEIAKTAGVSHNTLNKVEHIKDSNEEDLKIMLLSGTISIDRAEQERKLRERDRKRKDFAEKGKRFPINDIYCGNFVDVLSNIEPGSVDAIITDPPYHKRYLYLYSALAVFAKEKLRDHGFLVTYAGQFYLPDVMKLLGEYLDYYWTIGIIHQGHTPKVDQLNVICDWKPVLVYQKGKKIHDKTFHDLITSGSREKTYHDWGQSVQEAIDLMDVFTKRRDLVVDPFLGGGTTALAAYSISRNFIGADIVEENVNISRKRIIDLRAKKMRNIQRLFGQNSQR